MTSKYSCTKSPDISGGKRRKRSKSKVRIPIRSGTLSKYGYKTSKSKLARRRSLNKAAKAEGTGTIIQALNARSIVNKNQNPKVSKIFRQDAQYLRSKQKK